MMVKAVDMALGQIHTEVDDKKIIGWREWVALPQLGIPAIKAKVDTGARTSALHAYKLEPFVEGGVTKIRFNIHPLQKRDDIKLYCIADVIDQRIVTDSGGHREERYVIRTPLQVGKATWEIELTLTNRDTLLFRMLLGRTAMHSHLVVDPTLSYVTGRKLRRAYRQKLAKSIETTPPPTLPEIGGG